MSDYLVTVVMPALNEELNLAGAVENVLHSFERSAVAGQLLIINDGSSDRTGPIAEAYAAAYPFVQVIHHATPQGIGASFWDGAGKSAADVVTMIPGDGENDAFEILRYLPLMAQVDIVIPFVYNREARSVKRRLLSIFYREIIKASFGLSLNYMNGTVMYRRTVFTGIELKNGGFFYQTELLIKTIRSGYLYAEVPCALLQRAGGNSHATTFRSLLRVARGFLSTFADIHVFGTGRRTPEETTVSAVRLRELQGL